MKKVVVVSAKRTPIGKFLGSFKDLPAADLGAIAVKSALSDGKIGPETVDELIFGNARQAGSGPNIARQIAYKAGLPVAIPAYTVNKACASSLKAIVLAYQAIALGDAEIVVAGGAENMTRVPFILDNCRMGYRLGDAEVHDGMYKDGFLCPLCKELMGKTAENLADKYRITRDEQDRYAAESQRLCEAARKAGKFSAEIAPVEIPAKKGEKTIVALDEHPRDGVTAEALASLPPVFKKDGTVHAGNSSGITDGAAAVVVMSEEKARSLNIRPLAEIEAYTSAGVDPQYMGLGPVPAIAKLKEKTGVGLEQYDLIELNEAFAAQVIACDRELKFDFAKVNVNGGAIALGHPIGATGARIVVTLLHEMVRRKSRRGLATLCVSGGMGMAVSFRREE